MVLSLILLLHVWTWTHLTQRLSQGTLTRAGAVGRYAFLTSAPAVLFLMGLLLVMGLEEWLAVAMIPESLGRAGFPILAGLLLMAVLSTCCFALRCRQFSR